MYMKQDHVISLMISLYLIRYAYICSRKQFKIKITHLEF